MYFLDKKSNICVLKSYFVYLKKSWILVRVNAYCSPTWRIFRLITPNFSYILRVSINA